MFWNYTTAAFYSYYLSNSVNTYSIPAAKVSQLRVEYSKIRAKCYHPLYTISNISCWFDDVFCLEGKVPLSKAPYIVYFAICQYFYTHKSVFFVTLKILALLMLSGAGISLGWWKKEDGDMFQCSAYSHLLLCISVLINRRNRIYTKITRCF